jgi:hypothetical protein
MNEDALYKLIKEKGIKNIAKNYFLNIEDEHWIIWLKDNTAVYLDKNFLSKYPITSCFDEANGQLILDKFDIQKIPKKILKKIKKDK